MLTMKQLLSLLLIGFLFTGCKKDKEDINTADLSGKWRLLSVTDKNTNTTTTKPANITGEVEISFSFSSSASGQISGHTTSNVVGGGCKVTRKKGLAIFDVLTTYAVDTEWGYLFIANIDKSRNYSFDVEGRLSIYTSNNKELIFTRL